MKPRDGRRPDKKQPAAAGRAGRGRLSPEAKETGRQTIRGLWRLCLMLLAAILGALSVEAVRAIF